MSSVEAITYRARILLPDGAEFVIEADEEQMQRNQAAMEYLKAILEDESTEEERAETWRLLKAGMDEHRDAGDKLFPGSAELEQEIS